MILKYPLTAAERDALILEFQRSKFKIKEIFSFLSHAEYKFIYGDVGAPIQLQIICDAKSAPEPTLVRKIMRRAGTLVSFAKTKTPLNIIWIPCPVKRELPAPGQPINAEHINGGYTYMNGNTIYIYRYEEFAKVLLHEILHHSELDIGRQDWPDLGTLRRVFNIAPETPLSPNEAVIETWAELYQLMFLAAETEIPLDKLIEKEARHALCQSAKLLAHARTGPWRETTNAFSYIIFRTIFLCHLPEFIAAPRTGAAYNKILIDGWKSPEFQNWLAAAEPNGCDLRMSAFNNY